MSPGPSLLVIIHNTVIGDRGQGVMASIGHGIGVTIYALIAVGGLALIHKIMPLVYHLLGLFGGLLLLFIGIMAWKKSFDEMSMPIDTNERRWVGFFGGLTISLVNPQVVFFFIAIFGQYSTLEHAWAERLILGVTAGTIDFLWYLIIVMSLSKSKIKIFVERYSKIVERGIASSFCLLSMWICYQYLSI